MGHLRRNSFSFKIQRKEVGPSLAACPQRFHALEPLKVLQSASRREDTLEPKVQRMTIFNLFSTSSACCEPLSEPQTAARHMLYRRHSLLNVHLPWVEVQNLHRDL